MRPSGRRRSCSAREGDPTPREIQHSAVGTQRVVHAGNLSALPSRRARSSSLWGHVGGSDARMCEYVYIKRAYLRKRRDFTRRGLLSSLSLSLSLPRSCAAINYRVTRSGHSLERKNIRRGVKMCLTYDRFSIATRTTLGKRRKETQESFGRSEFVEPLAVITRGAPASIGLLFSSADRRATDRSIPP